MDSGANGFYAIPGAPLTNVDPAAPRIAVGTATGAPNLSSARADSLLTQLPPKAREGGHIMPSFKHNLMGLGPICDADCTVTFSKTTVTIFDPRGQPIGTGWREPKRSRLWRISLLPEAHDIPTAPDDAESSSLQAFSAYDLPSVQALVHYLHAAAGFPVKSTWLKAIKAGNFATWPGLTYNNAAKYYPHSSDETIMGHLAQSRDKVCVPPSQSHLASSKHPRASRRSFPASQAFE